MLGQCAYVNCSLFWDFLRRYWEVVLIRCCVGLEGAHCLVCKTVQSSIFVTCWYLWLTGYFTWDPVKKAAAKAGCRNRYGALRLSWNAVLAKWFSKEGRVFGALGWALTDGGLEGAGWSCWSCQLWAASLCSVATATPACASPAWNWALSCCCSQPGTVKQVLILLYRDAPGRKQKQFRSWAESWLSWGVTCWGLGSIAESQSWTGPAAFSRHWGQEFHAACGAWGRPLYLQLWLLSWGGSLVGLGQQAADQFY